MKRLIWRLLNEPLQVPLPSVAVPHHFDELTTLASIAGVFKA